MKQRRFRNAGRHQRGLTLIELLVALGLGLLVVVIAATALLLGQQGYRSVDATTQLRDRERFATDLLARVIIQAGYQDLGAANVSLRSTAALLGNDPEPDVYGWNNAVYKAPEHLFLSEITNITSGNRPTSTLCTANDTSCKNGSDVLVVRYQGVTNPPDYPIVADRNKADNTMINCMGQGEASLITGDLNDRAASIFHVTREDNGEPSLSCSYYKFASSGGGWVASTPLIEGVESFQVLFGTDGVSPGLAPSATAVQDTVAERWLRADQLAVAGNPAATRENWRRVRAVRVGLVLRGPVGSALQASTATLAPLGSLYASTNDTGSNLAVAADGRLRQQSTFTVHLRNDLSLR